MLLAAGLASRVILSIASVPSPFHTQVKGQIKLRFTSANKRPAVCTRSFSLTQKPQKREYKAFECALKTVTDEGKQQSLSYKASDLNKVVPEMMGVSTAVLDSVIFVHQEDSCWPLSEELSIGTTRSTINTSSSGNSGLSAGWLYMIHRFDSLG